METILLMARPSTISILTDGFIATVGGLVFIRSVISGMTAGAVGLKCGELPRYDLRV